MEDTNFNLWAKVLVYLYTHPNEMKKTVWHISQQLRVSSNSSIANAIQLLEKKGLLKIEHKGRANNYIMTEKGTKVAEHLNKVFVILK